MVLDRPLELMRDAVIRDGHHCSLCGRPCGEEEARRHSEAGPFGDSSRNFAAMCDGCQTWLAHEGVKPARYIVHVYDQTKARRRLRMVIHWGGIASIIAFYSAVAVLGGIAVLHAPRSTYDIVGLFLLLILAISVWRLVRQGALRLPGMGRRRPDLTVHHSYDTQHVRMETEK